MNRPRLEVAEVIRSCYDAFLERYGKGLTPEQRRALDDLARCRTAALGGHVLECPQCGHQQIAYNSCGNRHCPKCQATASARWLEAQAADLLPVPYFHVVFTLPSDLGPIALHNPRQVYGLLMRAAAETLTRAGRRSQAPGCQDRRPRSVAHLGPEPRSFIPTSIASSPEGGLSLDETRWITGSDRFFLPVQVLSRVFRGKFLAGLHAAFRQGQLRFPGKLAAAGRLRTVQPSALPDGANRMGRACQATDQRTRHGPEIPGPVHAQDGHQQPPPAQSGGWPGYLPLEGLRSRRAVANHDARCDRVRPPVSHARAALGLRADPPLWDCWRIVIAARSWLGAGSCWGPPRRLESDLPDLVATPEPESPVTPTQVCPDLRRGPDDRDRQTPAPDRGPGELG